MKGGFRRSLTDLARMFVGRQLSIIFFVCTKLTGVSYLVIITNIDNTNAIKIYEYRDDVQLGISLCLLSFHG